MTRYRSEIIVSLFLILSILAVYGQVRHHEFINYDDDDYVTENHHVQAGWTMESLAWAFTARFHRHWHPLTWLSHMTDCQFFGLNPGWHHLTSVFLHTANTVLLFLVFGRMTGALFRSAFVAALFALHPLNVEPVAWVADRKDVLSAFFWMVTMWAYARYAERPGFKRYVAVLIPFVLGLMAKSMVVTLPFVLLLLDYWPLERIRFGLSRRKGHPYSRQGVDARYEGTPALRLLLEKVFLFAIVGACLVVAVSAMHHERTLSLNLSGLWPTKVLIADTLVNYMTHIVKMLWPLNLATPYPVPDVLPIWQFGAAGLLLFGTSFFIVWQRRRYPYLLVGWLWYLITLVPVIGLVRVGPHKLADRYTYIPLIGIFLIVAWGGPDLLRGWRHRRRALAISASLLLLGCMTGAWLQVRHWKNSLALFKHAVSVTDNNYVAHNNLGVELNKEGRLEEAIHHYAEALRIRPGYAHAHVNLGLTLARQGRLNEAIHHYSEAIKLRPRYAEAHNKLGVALARQGRLKEAIDQFSEALKIKPNSAEAHINLGAALAEQGDLNEATGRFSEALKIKPDSAEAHNNLGLALARQGHLKKAIHHYYQALDIMPDYAEAHNNLGLALREQGRLKEAVDHFSEALKIRPGYGEALDNLKFGLRLMKLSKGA